jgi:hypothetical protein
MNIQFLINTAHTPEPAKLMVANKRRTDVCLKTHAIVFIMHCCGINRLFDKTCVEELLFRMGLLLKRYAILDSFFKKDVILNNKFLGDEYVISIEDLKAHLGLEIFNSPYDFTNQDEWVKNYQTYWKNACLTCIFGDTPIVDSISSRTGANERTVIDISIDLNDTKYINNISFFTTEVLRLIGNKPFSLLEQRVFERRKELSELTDKLLEKLPFEFDYAKIPLKIKEQYFEVICGPVLKYLNYFKEVSNDETCSFAALLHLGWLWDNNYVKVNKIAYGNKRSYYAEVDPRVKFDYNYYDGLHNLEFGINLFYTYRDNNLEKLKGLLTEKH